MSSPPIADGTVAIDGERINQVAPGPAGTDAEDLGNVAILPGFVNAHTHLEFSDLATPLGEPGMPFVDWIRLVVEQRRRAPAADSAVGLGLRQSALLGTTALGEIVQPGWPVEEVQQANLDTTVFLELIAPTAARVPAALLLAQEHLALGAGPPALGAGPPALGAGPPALGAGPPALGAGPPALGAGLPTPPNHATWRPGLSPHAPYSVHPELLARVVALSAEHRVPLAVHLAESPEELQLLRTGNGPLRELLEELRATTPLSLCGKGAGVEGAAQSQPGVTLGRPLEYLRTLAAAQRALIIHGNYLDDEEIAFLAAHAQRMTVVYCPRTHAFFRHAAYRLEKMLTAGVMVALGTDSRASAPDLSVLAEMRLVAARHPAVSGETVLKMATLHGAAALGHQADLGSLEPGKYADLAIVALPDRAAADPHDLLLNSDRPVIATWRRGVEIARE